MWRSSQQRCSARAQNREGGVGWRCEAVRHLSDRCMHRSMPNRLQLSAGCQAEWPFCRLLGRRVGSMSSGRRRPYRPLSLHTKIMSPRRVHSLRPSCWEYIASPTIVPPRSIRVFVVCISDRRNMSCACRIVSMPVVDEAFSAIFESLVYPWWNMFTHLSFILNVRCSLILKYFF